MDGGVGEGVWVWIEAWVKTCGYRIVGVYRRASVGSGEWMWI